MTSPRRSPRRVVLFGLVCLTVATVPQAQVVDATDTTGRGLELAGIAAGYGPEWFWGVKVAHFPHTHLGATTVLTGKARSPSMDG